MSLPPNLQSLLAAPLRDTQATRRRRRVPARYASTEVSDSAFLPDFPLSQLSNAAPPVKLPPQSSSQKSPCPVYRLSELSGVLLPVAPHPQTRPRNPAPPVPAIPTVAQRKPVDRPKCSELKKKSKILGQFTNAAVNYNASTCILMPLSCAVKRSIPQANQKSSNAIGRRVAFCCAVTCRFAQPQQSRFTPGSLIDMRCVAAAHEVLCAQVMLEPAKAERVCKLHRARFRNFEV